jgi:hypothetical protein
MPFVPLSELAPLVQVEDKVIRVDWVMSIVPASGGSDLTTLSGQIIRFSSSPSAILAVIDARLYPPLEPEVPEVP